MIKSGCIRSSAEICQRNGSIPSTSRPSVTAITLVNRPGDFWSSSSRNSAANSRTCLRKAASSSWGAGKLTSQVPAPPKRVSNKSSDLTIGLLARKFLLKSVSTCRRNRPAAQMAVKSAITPPTIRGRCSTQTVRCPSARVIWASAGARPGIPRDSPSRIAPGRTSPQVTSTIKVASVIMMPKLATGAMLLVNTAAKPAAVVAMVQKIGTVSSSMV